MMLTRTTELGSIIALVMAGLFAAAPAASAAGDEVDTRTRTVSTRGLDLNSLSGQAALHRRIANAAVSVCGGYDPRDLKAVTDYDRCREQAIADASAQASVLIARVGAATLVADAGASRP